MIELFAMPASFIKYMVHCEIAAIINKNYIFYSENGTTSSGLHSMPTNNLSITVGVIVGTCVVLTVGVVIFIFFSRCVQNLVLHSSARIFILKLTCYM